MTSSQPVFERYPSSFVPLPSSCLLPTHCLVNTEDLRWRRCRAVIKHSADLLAGTRRLIGGVTGACSGTCLVVHRRPWPWLVIRGSREVQRLFWPPNFLCLNRAPCCFFSWHEKVYHCFRIIGSRRFVCPVWALKRVCMCSLAVL